MYTPISGFVAHCLHDYPELYMNPAGVLDSLLFVNGNGCSYEHHMLAERVVCPVKGKGLINTFIPIDTYPADHELAKLMIKRGAFDEWLTELLAKKGDAVVASPYEPHALVFALTVETPAWLKDLAREFAYSAYCILCASTALENSEKALCVFRAVEHLDGIR